MDKDDLRWEKIENASDEWHESIRVNEEVHKAVGNFILTFKDAPVECIHASVKGGYNVVFQMEFKDGSSIIMRIPMKGMSRSIQYYACF